MTRMSGQFVPVALRAPKTITSVATRAIPSGRPSAVVFPVDMGFSGGKISPLAMYRTGGAVQLHFVGSEVPFTYEKDETAHTIGEESLIAGIRSSLAQASKGFDPSIPRIITVDTMGAGFTVIGPQESTAVPMILYTNPATKDPGLESVISILGNGDRAAALLSLQLACGGQVEVGVYNLFHQAGLAASGSGLTAKHRVLNLPDFIYKALSENNVEMTEASFVRVSLGGDRSALNWNYDLMRRLGINAVFPNIVPTGKNLGPADLELRRAMNADEVTLIAGPTHDTAGSVAGLRMCTDPDDVVESSGSWDIMCAPVNIGDVTDEVIRELFIRSLGIEGATGNEFIAANVKGGMLVESLLAELNYTGDSRFARLFAGIEDAGIPYALIDLNSSNFTYGQVGGILKPIEDWCWRTYQLFDSSDVKSLAKTIAMSIIMGKTERINQFRPVMQMLGNQPKSVQAGGGFAMNNHLLTQAFADASALPVRLRFKGLSGIGNAAIAFVGAGLATREEMQNCLEALSSDVVFDPTGDAAARGSWDKAYKRYLEVKEKGNKKD